MFDPSARRIDRLLELARCSGGRCYCPGEGRSCEDREQAGDAEEQH